MIDRATWMQRIRARLEGWELPLLGRWWARFAGAVSAVGLRLFPERQIIVRAHGHISHVVLSKRVQLGIAAAGLSVLAWTGIATYLLIDVRGELNRQESALDHSRNSYSLLRDQVAAYQSSVQAAIGELDIRQAGLRELFNQNEALRADLRATEKQLQTAEAEKARVADARLAMRRRLEQMEASIQDMRGEKDSRDGTLQAMRARIFSLEAERNEVISQRGQLDRRMWSLEHELAGAAERGNMLNAGIQSLRGELKKVTAERSKALEDNQRLVTRVRELEQQLAAMEVAHREVLRKLAERTRQSVDDVERTIARTGVPIKKLLRDEADKNFGQGGPFIAIRPPSADGPGMETLLASLDIHVGRMGDLQSLLRALPLSAPLENYTIMSGFGERRDPFTGRTAMHNGLDLGSKYGSPIRATAPGVVTYAGWRANYGRIVEIDHGRGIITRYAHMSRVDVKMGQKIGLRALIGTVGSSGRSTGAHVHYEIIIK
ncbi:MAG: hypothetical protein FJX52_16655, partial [Alphaproteobacteria bacterium]|nr:hypothetical protein [Alphaproteobacteria bacterium]